MGEESRGGVMPLLWRSSDVTSQSRVSVLLDLVTLVSERARLALGRAGCGSEVGDGEVEVELVRVRDVESLEPRAAAMSAETSADILSTSSSHFMLSVLSGLSARSARLRQSWVRC